MVCITARAGSAMRANLAAKGRIAVTAAHPATYSSAQLKGTIDVVRDPTDEEYDRVETHRARFAVAAAEVRANDVECLMLGDLVAVGFMADESYDQTPGGRAGQALT